MRSEDWFKRKLKDILNLVVHAVTGTNINRRTVKNIRMAGMEIVFKANMGGTKIMKMIKAINTSIVENSMNRGGLIEAAAYADGERKTGHIGPLEH